MIKLLKIIEEYASFVYAMIKILNSRKTKKE